jgi:type IV secretion system protein VirD4
MNDHQSASSFSGNVALVLLGALLALCTTVWCGAQLAARCFGAGDWLDVSITDAAYAVAHLGSHLSSPGAAWKRSAAVALPGPVAYWCCTLLVFVVASAVLIPAVTVLLRSPGAGSPRRRRLGVDTQARLARPRELAPLIVPAAQPGRFVLGRVGRHLVATEQREPHPTTDAATPATTTPLSRLRVRWWSWRGAARQGDRSSVLMVGPTRCGKTANAIAGILEWSGPAILSSVKSDLIAATLHHRASLGEVRVFDPTASTDQPCAGWSPLRAAGTLSGAQKAARALTDAGPRRGADSLDFFLSLAEQLLWPLLWVAAVSDHTMRDVVRWVLTQDCPTPTDLGEVGPLLDAQLYHPDPARQIDAAYVFDSIQATWMLDDRTRSNVYATVQTLVTAWSDPTVAASSLTHDIDLEWLLAGANTLYVCAPQHEQARLAPVFGGLIGDLIQQAFERAGRTNQPLPPTLVVLDEAANTPTRWLPGVASTCAGIGLLLVTIWQSKAQIDAAYGKLADSVITNHGTKIIFSGVSDPATLDYAARLLGDEEILRRSTSLDLAGARRSVSDSVHSTRLVPAHVLRQVRPGEALLIHGTLPPAHLHARPYFRERHLRALAHQPATTCSDAIAEVSS